MGETIRFRVVKEPHGWAVRMGDGMMTAFGSRNEAISHAERRVAALRLRGRPSEVVIEAPPLEAVRPGRRAPRFRWF